MNEQWPQSRVMALIEAYRKKQCLWDVSHKEYCNRFMRSIAWKEVAESVGCDVQNAEKKMKILRTQLIVRYKRRKNISECEDFRPKWFAYDALQFLLQNRKPSLDINKHPDIVKIKKIKKVPVYSSKKEINNYVPLLQNNENIKQDDLVIFSEYVVSRLRNISNPCTRLIAQNKINNILFEAEMTQYQSHNENIVSVSDSLQLSPLIQSSSCSDPQTPEVHIQIKEENESANAFATLL